MVAFCIIIGDTIPHVLAALFPSLPATPFLWLLTNRRAVIVVFVLGISYPLSLYRDIAKVSPCISVTVTVTDTRKLAKASTLALISMLVILITVITQGVRMPPELRGQLRGSVFINSGVFGAISVISFGIFAPQMLCPLLTFGSFRLPYVKMINIHFNDRRVTLLVPDHNSLLIYGSLKRPTLDRFARVTHFSTGVSMVACMAMALSGFLTFGDKTQGNLLNNFPKDNIMVNISRL